MIDVIKPATRADVEAISEINQNTRVDALIATLESWVPVMKALAKQPCRHPPKALAFGIDPFRCGKCGPDIARKLMEQYEAGRRWVLALLPKENTDD